MSPVKCRTGRSPYSFQLRHFLGYSRIRFHGYNFMDTLHHMMEFSDDISCTGTGVVGLWLTVNNALFYILRGVLQSQVTPASTSKPALLKTSHGANCYWTAGRARPEMDRPSMWQFPECQQTAVWLDRQHSWCPSIQSSVCSLNVWIVFTLPVHGLASSMPAFDRTLCTRTISLDIWTDRSFLLFILQCIYKSCTRTCWF